jgi:hypothetical protein
VASPGWTSPAELVAQVERLWDRGTLLRAAVQSDPLFPMALRLRGPTSRDHTKFIEVHRSLLGELLELTLPPESIKVEPGSSFDRVLPATVRRPLRRGARAGNRHSRCIGQSGDREGTRPDCAASGVVAARGS